MLIHGISILTLCIAAATAAATAIGGEVAKLDRKVVAFQDQASKDTLLLMSADGKVDWLVGGKLTKKGNYRITDDLCIPTTQSTTTMDQEGGMTLVYPFLVGVQRACYFDEKYKTLRLLGVYKKDLPRNPFSLVYAGGDDQAQYFLINGRPFPDGTEGYLSLLTISKKEFKAELRDFVGGVPGLSGAMWSEKDSVWITVFPGSIFQVLHSDLHEKIRDQVRANTRDVKKVEFSRLAKEVFHDLGDGMSLFILGNQNSLLYFNDEYDSSYTVSKANGKVTVVKPPCPPIAGYEDQWLVLCDGNRIETWRD